MAFGVALGLSGIMLVIQPIPIDFKIDGSAPAPATAPAVRTVNEQALALEAPGPVPLHAASVPPQAVVRPLLARGFGRDVPLAFAIRQIVPTTLHVQYSDAVDQNVRVSWAGGLPWRKVLQNTVSPLGIHAAQSGSTVRITE